MIDTDKYEGHTPGPWVFHPIDCASFCKHDRREACGCWYCESRRTDTVSIQSGSKHDLPWTIVVNELRMGHQDSDGADAQLMADAPLILEAYKRLREQGRKLIEAAERVRSDISDQDTGWYYQLGNHIEKMNRLVKE